ncbi:MAG: Isoleucyl-tRNA synthetase [Candidatus Azambacteria bacterium GW2011_GWA2_39_10]|uniref:isoleucine--tRNA ligase n=1 Tax=Candidatus Azambacteria bacterium GW2011_GWA2_39_10 TaxID=1618611 RepID=A0A0G0LHG7_9BACT|nr:MAG: Isoleucyl-tRNA synthetase [Candidatus Azambacteria bacterium GW2011_GWA2_39_10]
MELFSPKTEEKILEFWQKNQIFEKLRKKNRNKKHWSFLDGPITANNPMGVHHAWGRTYKDLFQRYKAMRGFDQRFQNGFDAQGLWVEVEVEKELGFKSKKDIEKYGIAKFVEKCKERVRKYSEIQTKQSIRLGQWMDWKNSYYTMSNENNAAIWHFLKKCHQKGLLYKGLDVVPWCWRCGTAISQHEILTEDYKEVTHDSVYIEYPIVGNRVSNISNISNKKNAYLLVWTTTPWTLPGNVAVAIDPEKIYVEATGKIKGNSYYLIKTAAEKLNLKIIKTFKGKELVGLTYKSPFDNLPAVKKVLSGLVHKVVATDSRILPVSEEEGTGLVHIAPGQGVEDYRLAKKLKIPAVNLIDDAAVYLKNLGQFSGKNAKEHPEIIIDYLKTADFLFDAPKYTHRYPICWRCKTELVWKIADEWYISMDKLRRPLIEIAKKIKWIPSFGSGREIDWLKNMSDWLISKKRYWGLALPIFECHCGNFEVIGSLNDFDKHSPKKLNHYILLRHGEAENNRLKIISSYPEKKQYPLTIKGAQEIEKLIPWFKKKRVDLVFSSDILRARETSQIIAGALGKIVTYNKRLREHNFGAYNGRTHEEWHLLFGGSKTGQYAIKPPSGENLKDVAKRMTNFLKELDKKYEDKTILIVSHANPIAAVASAYNGYKNEETFEKFTIDEITGSVVEMPGHNWPYNNDGDLDLHRPYVDEIRIKCSKCGKNASRILDVGNPWLDAGIVPYSTMGYFEGKKFWRKWFPAELVCESFPGQFKNWFYSLIVMSTVLEKVPPMKTVFGYASVRDEKGEEMHKSKGNAIWFDEAAEKIGVDVMRWLYVKQNPADNLKFGYAPAKEHERKLMNLWNSFTFFKTYSSTIENLKFKIENSSLLDKWILSRLSNLIEKVTKNLDKYNPASASRAIEEFFIEDLSLWHIRRSRSRFQRPKSEREKELAIATLYLILLDLAKLIAPFLPFLSEEIYLFLKKDKMPESVHLCDWPKSDKKFINRKLEEQMNLVREISANGLALRAKAGIKVRQPLAALKFSISNFQFLKNNKELINLIKDEVNVKEIIFDKNIKRDFELDTVITGELKEEGIIRDLARQIQEMRKDGGLMPKDFVKIYFKIDNAELKNIVEKRQKNLIVNVGAKAVEFVGAVKDGLLIGRHFELENQSIWIGIQLLM